VDVCLKRYEIVICKYFCKTHKKENRPLGRFSDATESLTTMSTRDAWLYQLDECR